MQNNRGDKSHCVIVALQGKLEPPTGTPEFSQKFGLPNGINFQNLQVGFAIQYN